MIGPSAGFCGTAAYRGEPVIVEDIATDPLWADYRELALPHSLRACWSTPVFSSQGKVIATFAMYYRAPRRPTQRDQAIIDQITHLAGVIIQQKLAEEKLQRSEGYLAEAQKLTHTGSWVWNARTEKVLYCSDEMFRIFGLDPRESLPTREHFRQTQERFERNERAGKEIYARMAELKNIPRENLPDAVFMLSMAAKHQSEQIRQSIKDRTRDDFDCDRRTDGDLATYLAEDAGYALRDHVTNPQIFFEAMSEQLPDVHFTIQQQDAVSMMAAMIREQRLEGILGGLRLAGLLNEASKRGRTSPQTEGVSCQPH